MATRTKVPPTVLIYRSPRHGERVLHLREGSRTHARVVAFIQLIGASANCGTERRPATGQAVRKLAGRDEPTVGSPRGSAPSAVAAKVPFEAIASGSAPARPTAAAAPDRDTVHRVPPNPPALPAEKQDAQRRVKSSHSVRDLALLGPEDLMTPEETCRYLNIADSTGRNWRLRGYGPEHIRVSPRCLRFRKGTVDAWLQARSVCSTSESIADA